MPASSRESLYRQAWAFGRVLQVRDGQWPPDTAAFERWWVQQEALLSVDEEVRGYLHAVLRGGRSPWHLKPALPLQRFVTRGLMSPRLRELFHLPWSARDQRNWQRFRRWAPRLYWATPRWLRHWPARYYLARLRQPSASTT